MKYIHTYNKDGNQRFENPNKKNMLQELLL